MVGLSYTLSLVANVALAVEFADAAAASALVLAYCFASARALASSVLLAKFVIFVSIILLTAAVLTPGFSSMLEIFVSAAPTRVRRASTLVSVTPIREFKLLTVSDVAKFLVAKRLSKLCSNSFPLLTF